MVSELSSHQENPYNLEKISWNGGLQIGKDYKNQAIEIQLILHSLEEAREELRKSSKRRKEIAIAKDDTQHKEIDTTKFFAKGDINEIWNQQDKVVSYQIKHSTINF